MLTMIMITIPVSIITLLFNLFPAIPIASGITSSLASATSGLWSLNALIPIPTFAVCVAILVTAEILVLAFKATRVIISHVPFVGGRG